MSLYTISSQKSGYLKYKEAQLVMFDRAHWEEKDLIEHFHSIRSLFIQKAEALDKTEYLMDKTEERDLQFMLESLIQVKHVVHKTAVEA
ncbi:MAG: hypothetical protein ACI9H6_000744 [Patiriisocius sp.]|jgi:hypothetical protein